MSKLEAEVVAAVVTEIGNSGQVVDGEVGVRLVCGDQDLILTLPPMLATKLADGLKQAAKDADRAIKNDGRPRASVPP
jgi:hypothetical protein